MIESLKQQQPTKKRGNKNKKLKAPRAATGSMTPARPKPKRDRGNPAPDDGRQRHPFLGLLLTSASALVLLALSSEAGPRWAGPLGHRLAQALLHPLGLLAFTVPATLGYGAALLLGVLRPSFGSLRRLLGLLGGTLSALLFCAVVTPQLSALGNPVAGQWLSTVAAPIGDALSVVGGGVLTFGLGFACFSVVSGHALSRALAATLRVGGRTLWTGARLGARWSHGAIHTAVQEHREARFQRDSLGEDTAESGPGASDDDSFDSISLDAAVADEAARRAEIFSRPSLRGKEISAIDASDLVFESEQDAMHAVREFEPPDILTIGEDGRVRNGSTKPERAPIELATGEPPLYPLSSNAAETLAAPQVPPGAEATDAIAPQIVDFREPPLTGAPKKKKANGAFQLSRTGKGFTLPSVDLLDSPPDVHQDIDRGALTETAQKLTQKLADFGIKGRVETIRPGPVITMYEFVPAPGIRVSKIAALSDDLAMAMEALQVRIVAPIPGKNVVGIEVPNRQRQKVYLREILEDEGFAKMTSPLTLAFGKDTEGTPYVGDLSRMPHLLVAGTTGSGKSVSMNSMIMSLLFKATPDDVRMIMIDPKMVELSMYEGIPHLLLPVVQDVQKAPLALRWAVDEMERRYQLIGKLKVKDLKAYNEKVARLKQGEKLEADLLAEPTRKVVVVDVANGETEEEALARLAEGSRADLLTAPTSLTSDSTRGQIDVSELEKLPYIVIIIDELADLMMIASRDVEQAIARIAAKARAAGIHLVIATQRPSTDVISGVIKSNLPVRIAFRLASRHDSATIINGPGAERLLGEGDMLHIPPGCSDTQRLHGAWLRETEIERVVDFWKAQGKPVYDEEILKPRVDEGDGEGSSDKVPDELYDQALAVVCQLEKVSISLLQRKMGVGYNRAADLIERMERDGAIGPANGIKPREVFLKPVGELRI